MVNNTDVFNFSFKIILNKLNLRIKIIQSDEKVSISWNNFAVFKSFYSYLIFMKKFVST